MECTHFLIMHKCAPYKTKRLAFISCCFINSAHLAQMGKTVSEHPGPLWNPGVLSQKHHMDICRQHSVFTVSIMLLIASGGFTVVLFEGAVKSLYIMVSNALADLCHR